MQNMIFPLLTEYEMKLPYCIAGIGCFHNQEHVIRRQGYPYFQWIQCHHGKGELITEGSIHSVGENQGMLLLPDTPHEYYAVSDSWVVDWIIFGGSHVADFFKQTASIGKSGVYYVSQPDIIPGRLRKALDIQLSDRTAKSLECSCIAYEVLMDLLKYTSLKSDSSMHFQYNRLKPLFDFIDSNYHKTLTLANMSDVAGVTPQHLCVLFKKATCMRIFEYVNLVRIKKSKEFILKDRETQIKEIAGLVGYDDVSYFCLQFRKFEQISPNAFRKLHTYA